MINLSAQITMETSTSFSEALELPFFLFWKFWDNLVKISEERKQELERESK